MKPYKFFALALIVFAVGCKSASFKKPELVKLDKVGDHGALVKSFKQKLPKSFSLVNSLIFERGFFQQISAIGVIKVDIIKEKFTAVGLNPLGLKLFEISADKDGATTSFAIEQIALKGNFTKAIGTDIRRVYFNLIPGSDARMTRRTHEVVYEDFKDGKTQYIFAGGDGRLTQKRRYNEEGDLLWSVSYYEYFIKDGKLYMGGIVMDNEEFGYRLTIKQKRANVYEQD